MENQKEVFNLSWEEFQLAMDMQAFRLDAWKKYKSKPAIIAIGRGGLIPATILSYELGIPIAHVVFAKSYKGQENIGTKMTELASIPQKMVKDCVFVDDILDTGGTFEAVKAKYPEAKFATPFAKMKGFEKRKMDLIVQPSTFFADEVWLNFPWDRN